MKIEFKPIFKDILLTFITQAITLAAFFFIYRLIAKNFGPEGVGEYSLVKRVIGFLQAPLLLGLNIGIPRYVAISRNEKERSSYIKAGVLVVTVFSLIFLVFINIFKSLFAEIFFGTANYINLTLPLSFFLAGLILHNLVYSYFRGRSFIKTFNSLQVVNIALVPIGILLIIKNVTIDNIIMLVGIITLIISLTFFLYYIKDFFISIDKLQFKSSLKELLSYGIPRVPGDFAFAGLMSLGPILGAHFATIKEVGYLSLSQSLLGILGAAVAPLGLVLLPKVSNLISQAREKEIRESLNFFIGAFLQCSIFICFQLMIFIDVIVNHWLGYEFITAIPVLRIVFVSIIFYVFYVAMRSILDASKKRPLNTINIVVSLGIFLLIAAILLYISNIFDSIISLSIAFSAGLICLGILTYISIRKIYPEKLTKDFNYLWTAVVLNTTLAGLAIFVKPLLVQNLYYLVGFLALLGIIYMISLWLLEMEWIKQISKQMFKQKKLV
jgi:O-antigen/teichoic acid export membrane protein